MRKFVSLMIVLVCTVAVVWSQQYLNVDPSKSYCLSNSSSGDLHGYWDNNVCTGVGKDYFKQVSRYGPFAVCCSNEYGNCQSGTLALDASYNLANGACTC